MNIVFTTNNIFNDLKFKSKSVLILEKSEYHNKLKKLLVSLVYIIMEKYINKKFQIYLENYIHNFSMNL